MRFRYPPWITSSASTVSTRTISARSAEALGLARRKSTGASVRIQAMVLAGMGISFMPAFSPVIPGLLTRAVIDPEITRDVSLASIVGRRFSPAVATFVRAVQSYKWPSEHLYAQREGAE